MLPIPTLPAEEAVKIMNSLGGKGIPFIFVIDFEGKNTMIETLPLADTNPIQYSIKGETSNHSPVLTPQRSFRFDVTPPKKEDYIKKFRQIMDHIQYGNTYLINLTQPSQVDTDLSLEDIFRMSRAPYKLLVKDHFTVFSPELFVETLEGKIFSRPMKGTIDARIPDAENVLRQNRKEVAEHYTIVDLIRNDLAMISQKVEVKQFMYTELIETHRGPLLQASSLIEGTLPPGWESSLGEWFFRLLPAGSISGAPKKKTIEILLQAEGYSRGFYTGVFGVFDGKDLTSAVMIRFIEKTAGGLVYKSGGGITHQSEADPEYRELIQKVYVPFI